MAIGHRTKRPKIAKLDALPRELSLGATRSARLSRTGVSMYWLMAFLVLAGFGVAGGLWLSSFREAEVERRLAAEGVQVRATVERIRIKRGDSKQYIAHYVFDAGGRQHGGTARLRKRDRTRVTEGSQVAVRYFRGEPARNWMVGYEPKGVPAWVPIVAGAGVVLAAPLVLIPVRRERRLLEQGRAALATVTGVKKTKGESGDVWKVEYEWRLLDGSTHRGKFDMGGKIAPEPGSRFALLYDRDNPRRHVRWPLTYVSVDRG